MGETEEIFNFYILLIVPDASGDFRTEALCRHLINQTIKFCKQER